MVLGVFHEAIHTKTDWWTTAENQEDVNSGLWTSSSHCVTRSCIVFASVGEREQLWKVTEGLGDLNMAREHPDLATMYYRETLAMGVHLHSRTKSSSEKIIAKLTRALEDHKSKRLDLASSREKRVPHTSRLWSCEYSSIYIYCLFSGFFFLTYAIMKIYLISVIT